MTFWARHLALHHGGQTVTIAPWTNFQIHRAHLLTMEASYQPWGDKLEARTPQDVSFRGYL